MGVYHRSSLNYIQTKRTLARIPNLDNDISYLIGVVSGDGNVTRTERKKGGFHYRVKITSNSEEYLKSINEIFYRKFDIRGQIERDNRKNKTFYLTIQNSTIFAYFIVSGLRYGRKLSMNIPQAIKNNKNFFLHYLSGLVDTDGHIDYNRVHLKQKYEYFLEEIRIILLDLDMNPNEVKINYTNSRPFYYLRFDNKLPDMPQ